MSKATRILWAWKAQDGWRWRLFCSGRIIAESGEAYTRRGDAIKAAKKVFAQDYPIVLQYDKVIGRSPTADTIEIMHETIR